MALKKKKAVAEEVVEKTEEVITPEEETAILEQDKKEREEGASTERLQKAVSIVSGKFDLDDTYTVRNFLDKGKVIKITMENEDFSITATIKNSANYGLEY